MATRIDIADLRQVMLANWDVVDALGASKVPIADVDNCASWAAMLIHRGATETTTADFLIDYAIERLGVDTGSGIRERALLLAGALRAVVQQA